MSALSLRPATVEDILLLRSWDDDPAVAASDPNSDWDYEDEIGKNPPGRRHLMAELDGAPIGFMEITDPERDESRYWGVMPAGFRAIDIWIGEAAFRGRGFGAQMMRAVIDQCFDEADVHTILIDPLASNVDAHRFYARLGFRVVERRMFGNDDCLVFSLDRAQWRQESSDA